MSNILIFDNDGVIADSLEIFMKTVINTCKKHGSNQVNTKEDFLNLFNGNLYENFFTTPNGVKTNNVNLTKTINNISLERLTTSSNDDTQHIASFSSWG